MNETEKREVHPAERIINAINTTAEVALKQGIEIGKQESQAAIKELLSAAKAARSFLVGKSWAMCDVLDLAIAKAESFMAVQEVESRIKEEIEKVRK